MSICEWGQGVSRRPGVDPSQDLGYALRRGELDSLGTETAGSSSVPSPIPTVTAEGAFRIPLAGLLIPRAPPLS